MHSALPSASSACSLGSVPSKLCGSGGSGGSSGSCSVLGTSQGATWMKQPATHVRWRNQLRSTFRGDHVCFCCVSGEGSETSLDTVAASTSKAGHSEFQTPVLWVYQMFFPIFLPITTRFQHQTKTTSENYVSGSHRRLHRHRLWFAFGSDQSFSIFCWDLSAVCAAQKGRRRHFQDRIWGHNAQPSKTTGQGTSIATEACWSCLGFWSSSALLTYSTWWCQAPEHPPAGGGSCGSTCLQIWRNMKETSKNAHTTTTQACFAKLSACGESMTCNLATIDKRNQAECTSNCLNQCPAALRWSHLQMGNSSCLIHPFLGLSDSMNLYMCREWSSVLTSTGLSPWMSGSSHHRANKNSETQKAIRIHRNDDKMQCFSRF